MNIKFTTKVFGAVAAALLLSTSANAAKCGKVTIADMNWASASLMANVVIDGVVVMRFFIGDVLGAVVLILFLSAVFTALKQNKLLLNNKE